MMYKVTSSIAVIASCILTFAACSSSTHDAGIPVGTANGSSSNTGTTRPESAGQHRDISAFINVQGTYCVPPSTGVPPGAAVVNGCVLYIPPAPNFEGWGIAPSTPICSGFTTAAIDYAGVINQFLIANGHPSLGTSFSGAVNEQRLPDGGGRVIVTLDTKNALAWAGCDPNFNFATATVLFGNKPNDVLAGARVALANSHLRLVYREPYVGAPILDFLELAAFTPPGYALETEQFHASGSGFVGSAYPGVTAGTPAQLVVGQNGTLKTVGKAAADGFTAEFVKINVK